MTRPQRWVMAVLCLLAAANVQLAAEFRYALARIEDKGDARTTLVREDLALMGQTRRLLQRVEDRAPAFRDKVTSAEADNRYEIAQLHALAVRFGCAIDPPATREVVPFPTDR